MMLIGDKPQSYLSYRDIAPAGSVNSSRAELVTLAIRYIFEPGADGKDYRANFVHALSGNSQQLSE